MGLIHTLNQHLGKTPDEIVALLNTPSWVLGSNVTEELHAKFYKQDVLLATPSTRHPSGFRLLAGGMTYDYEWSLETVKRHLGGYWFILASEHRNDIWPQVS